MRSPEIRRAKANLRQFFAAQSLPYLLRVWDECRAGTFGYSEQCHCLRGLLDGGYLGAESGTDEAIEAEHALLVLGRDYGSIREWVRRNRVLPMVLREIRRRTLTPTQDVERQEVCA